MNGIEFELLQLKHLPLCTYCNEVATTKDHVPPKVFDPCNRFTVPACHRCNMLLGRRLLLTVADRKEYIRKKHAQGNRGRNKNLRGNAP